MSTNIKQKSVSATHIINYSAVNMAQKFDNQYFETLRYKINPELDINTLSVRHSIDYASVMKTLLFRMRKTAKTNWTLKETKEHRKPRIAYCGYVKGVNDNQPVNLCKNTNGTLFFNGLTNCGSYWRCPVCAIKISQQKKELLSHLVKSHLQNCQNNTIGFLTLTLRHNSYDTLKKTLDKLQTNFRSFQNCRFFSRNKTRVNYLGMIKTLEVTYSYNNGWHPHLHILFFYNSADTRKIKMFQRWFIKKWSSYKNNNSLIISQNQQFITTDTDISDYLAKYDITSEMTKGQIKISKGLSPFTALAKLTLNDYSDMNEKNRLYGIYSNFVEHTQGKAFVFISPGIKKQYHEVINELDKSDDQIVNETTIDEILLKISVQVWKLIAKNDLQPLILNKYKENGLVSVFNLLTYFNDFNKLSVEIDKNDIPILI